MFAEILADLYKAGFVHDSISDDRLVIERWIEARMLAAFLFPRRRSNGTGVENLGLPLRCAQDEPAARIVHCHVTSRLALGMTGQDRFHRLDGSDRSAVGAEVVVIQLAHLSQPVGSLPFGTAELDEGDFLEETPNDLQAVAALAALAPGLYERAVVVVVRSVLQFARRPALDRDLDAALALVGAPDTVVEAELHLLIDVAGEVVRRHPAGVDVERRLAAVGVGVGHLKLHTVPRRAAGRADDAALPGRRYARQPPGQA